MHEYSSICAFTSLEDIKDKKVTIMGLGLNGGGEASARFFAKYGAIVTITDMKSAEDLAPTVESLRNDKSLDQTKLNFVLGEHRIEDFENADCVIKNPGVKYEGNKYLAASKSIETDLSIFLRFTKAPIIAVTGSKGKSSTVSAIFYGLQKAGYTAFLGGNITVSPLTFFDKTTSETPVVLELSSWQLSDLRGRKVLKPYISLLTKIVPDHQNWYGNMESYVADKKLIYADQTSEDYTICSYDDTHWGHMFASETKANVLWYSTQKLPDELSGVWFNENKKGFVQLKKINDDEIFSKPPTTTIFKTTPFAENLNDIHTEGIFNKTTLAENMNNILEDEISTGISPTEILDTTIVPGFHMKQNILNACLVMSVMGIKPSKTKEIMSTYPGIQHRLEYFNTWINYNFYNDSAATVPDATAEAIQSFETAPILLCGGTDKVLDFTPLANVANKARAIYVLAGTGTDKLLPLLKERNVSYKGPFNSLQEMLETLKHDLQKEICTTSTQIVFSPGATSFGMFKNEFDRGNQFKEKVEEMF